MNSSEKERIVALEVKVSSLCKKVDEIDDKVEKILTNELPHLAQQISIMGLKIAILVGIISFIGSAIGTIMLDKITTSLLK